MDYVVSDTDGMETRLSKIRKLEKKLVQLKHDLVVDAAQIVDDLADENEATFLLLTISEKVFSVPIACVDEVVQMAAVTPLPRKVWGVMGLVNYHGEMVAVVDMCEVIGLGKSDVTAEKTLLVCSLEKFKFAIMVDETTDVITVPKEDIQVAEEVLPGVLKAVGVLQVAGQAAIIIDVWSIALSVQSGNRDSDSPPPT